jgi:hypothetical protein
VGTATTDHQIVDRRISVISLGQTMPVLGVASTSWTAALSTSEAESTSTFVFGSSGLPFGSIFGSFDFATPAPPPAGSILSSSEASLNATSTHNTTSTFGAGPERQSS